MNIYKQFNNNRLKKQWAKQGLSIKSTSQIAKSTRFIYESRISFGSTKISLNLQTLGPHFGHHTYFRSGQISSLQEVGRYCSFGPNIIIGESEQPLNWLSTHPFQYETNFKGLSGIQHQNFEPTKPPPSIGNDVWVGANVLIMRGVTIGDGAIIGAGSIVTKDIPPYAIAVGAPARTIRYRFPPETIQRLLHIKWWDLPPSDYSHVNYSSIQHALEALENLPKRNTEYLPKKHLLNRREITAYP